MPAAHDRPRTGQRQRADHGPEPAAGHRRGHGTRPDHRPGRGTARRGAGRRPARRDRAARISRRAQPHDRVRHVARRGRHRLAPGRQPGRAVRRDRPAGGGDGAGGVGGRVRLRPEQGRRPSGPGRLDRAAPGRRVWLRHTSGHMCVVNSVVLADLGIDAATTELPGGRVATDSGGRPTGLLEERAQLLVGSLVYPYPLAELTGAIARAAGQYLKEGVTSCTEAGIGGGWVAHSPAELAAYAAARDQGRLGVRVELMTAGEVLHPLGAHAGDNLVAGLDLGISTGFGDDWLRLGAVKIFADGSLVGRTAALHDPYHLSGGVGYLQADAADLRAAIIAAHRSGWQVATHAIGDLAIDVVLDAYAHALERYPRRDPRHRIEHFAVVGPRQLARAAALGVIAVPQGRFASELGDGMLAAVGPARHGWLYPQRSLLAAGMVLPGSSDRPVVAGAPLLGIADMVNRRTGSGEPFNPDEAVTVEQALRAWTWGSAYASRQEHVKGSIAPGMLADLVVLSEDPTAVSPDRIAGLEVLATIVAGQFAYGSLD